MPMSHNARKRMTLLIERQCQILNDLLSKAHYYDLEVKLIIWCEPPSGPYSVIVDFADGQKKDQHHAETS